MSRKNYADFDEAKIKKFITSDPNRYHALCLLKVRDNFAKLDYTEAYHWLYAIASPQFDKYEPWEELEKIAEGEPLESPTGYTRVDVPVEEGVEGKPTFKEVANDIINNLLEAIPGQIEDSDWWPDELRHAIENANTFLNDERYQSGALSVRQQGDAVSVLDWLLKQSDLNILIMNDGCFYYEEDKDGDQELQPEDIVKMYLKENPQSSASLQPGIVEKLREANPYHIIGIAPAYIYDKYNLWVECCDTLARIIEGEKGKEGNNE
jgi:hypothetical protein